jgi:hypothetical protein
VSYLEEAASLLRQATERYRYRGRHQQEAEAHTATPEQAPTRRSDCGLAA